MQPVHNLTPCDQCHIYHCTVCGCPRDGSRFPNFPRTNAGNLAFMRHLLPEQERAEIDAQVIAAIGSVV